MKSAVGIIDRMCVWCCCIDLIFWVRTRVGGSAMYEQEGISMEKRKKKQKKKNIVWLEYSVLSVKKIHLYNAKVPLTRTYIIKQTDRSC